MLRLHVALYTKQVISEMFCPDSAKVVYTENMQFHMKLATTRS